MALVFVAGATGLPAVWAQILGASKERPCLRECKVAVLEGHALCMCDPAQHPAICAQDKAASVAGYVVNLGDEELDRLAYYETTFGRHAQQVVLRDSQKETLSALAFVANTTQALTGGVLTEEAFQDFGLRWEEVAARMAEELMAYHGRKTAQEMQKSLYSMRIRASSYVARTAEPQDPEHDLSKDVIVHAHKREYINFFAMEEMDLQYRRFDGEMSPVVNRGVSLVGHAAVVLPYDPERDAVLLVEQFRAAAYIFGEQRPWMWEPPAGLIDPGETPQQAARREAQEEAGLNIGHLDYVGGLYSSSGALGEVVHCFVGLTDVSEIEGGGGVPGEGEDIRSKVMSFHELMDAVDKNTFQDMPLVTTALWLARHRDRLRRQRA